LCGVSDEVVGRVKADPARWGRRSLNPGVPRHRSGAVRVFAAAEKYGDVAGGDGAPGEQRDHGVREVLANGPCADDAFVDGEVDAGVGWHVLKYSKRRLVELLHQHEMDRRAGTTSYLWRA